jgi:hypothetical protein
VQAETEQLAAQGNLSPAAGDRNNETVMRMVDR